ncbi:hypothetical protein C6N75_21580 [Streptomyces solincola]|uniref:HTH cro/C1-type domain-containing protein n=1 Tax=Streptomyces solincola TaxID=2100817 RepID=A0A2S9PS15_9ACTN|nr:helix-turn-helix transcriptional regulator [Streptomyces solincola]PRH77191.1 hypothetical protein C6N75_21580 [Streptomyces solincola]
MTFDPESLGRTRSDLAAALSSERRRAGLTQTTLAKRCNMSQTKISNIEGGKITPTIVDVELILETLGAHDPVATEILALVRSAHTEWQDTWASQRRGLDKKQDELARLEAVTTEFRFFLPTMITGLLATPDYVRASLDRSTGDIAKVVARKLERQRTLMDSSKSFTFLLTEQAVRWPLVPPLAMAVQLGRLASLCRIPHIRLGVIPLEQVGPVVETPLSVFTVYDRRLVQVETHTGALILRDYKDVSAYREDFERYEAHAVWGDECRGLLEGWAERFTRQRQ